MSHNPFKPGSFDYQARQASERARLQFQRQLEDGSRRRRERWGRKRHAVADPGPATAMLTVIGGGERYPLRLGNQLIGRGPEVDVALDSPYLSTRHAWVHWDGRVASAVDAGSTNGTRIDGTVVTAPTVLAPGSVLQLGDVELRLDVAGDASPNASTGGHWANHFEQANYGTINQAGRDVNHSWHEYRYGADDPWDELFQGHGPGRVLMALGAVVALSGFAIWMFLTLSSMRHSGTSDVNPFSKTIAGLPAPMVAFGAFILGGILASVGAGISRAARERLRRYERMRAR